jgi:hypothetical protein
MAFFIFITHAQCRCSFLTIPSAFKQRPISSLIIHSAILKALKETLPDPSIICHYKTLLFITP